MTTTKNTDLLFISSSATRVKKDKITYNKFVWPFIKEVKDLSIINLEDGYISNGFKNDNLKEYNLGIIYLIMKIFIKIKYIFCIHSNKNKNLNNVIAFDVYKLFFKIVLKVVLPKLVFTINWYGIRGRALIYACHKMGIKSVDIQHGLAAASRQRFYTNLNRINDHYLPSIFFCWSKHDRDILDLQFKKSKSYFLGNPNFYDITPKKNLFYENKYVVLILSIDLPPWLDEFVLYLNKKDISCIIKEHPVNEVKKKIPKFILKNNTFIKEKLPISALLSNDCIGCITEWSAGILDAFDAGIQCYTIGENGEFYYKSYSGIIKCKTINEFKCYFNSQPTTSYSQNSFNSFNAANLIESLL